MDEERTVRLFVSSPGDVDHERRRMEQVAQQLNGEFRSLVRIDVVRWETSFYGAHASFQEQIPEASDCDLVIAIFSARLGTELPKEFSKLMPDGRPFPSGTAYEVLTAIESRKSRDFPDIYVFRKSVRPVVEIDDDAALAQAKAQWTSLNAFFERWFKTPEGHFRAAFHSFKDTDEFADQVATLLREWLVRKVLHGASQVSWPIEINGSPFRGLEPFDAYHAPVFFGRSRDAERALRLLNEAAVRGTPFLLVIGASGIGKSSFVRAGLVPRLTTPGVVGQVDVWRVAMMVPGSKPIDALAEALFKTPEIEGKTRIVPALPEIGDGDCKTWQKLAELMRSSMAASVDAVGNALGRIAADEGRYVGSDRQPRCHLLLVVDQFDDLFAPAADAERERFSTLLAALVATKSVWVIATLRADLYQIYLANAQLLALKREGADYDLGAPGLAEFADIIRKPAQAAGLVYEASPHTGETLDERLLREAGSADILPLLQFTMQRLFDQRVVQAGETRLSIAAYESFGGLDGAIDRAGEDVLSGLGDAEIAAMPRLFRQLVGSIRSASFDESAQTEFALQSAERARIVADPPTGRLVDRLVAARLLTSFEERGVASLRFAHQRVIESWTRAREIVRSNEKFYRISSDIRDQLARWRLSGGDNSLLLSGLPLREARSLMWRLRNELDEDTHNFIATSISRHNIIRFSLRMLIFISLLDVLIIIVITILYGEKPYEQVLSFVMSTIYVSLLALPIVALFTIGRYRFNRKTLFRRYVVSAAPWQQHFSRFHKAMLLCLFLYFGYGVLDFTSGIGNRREIAWFVYALAVTILFVWPLVGVIGYLRNRRYRFNNPLRQRRNSTP